MANASEIAYWNESAGTRWATLQGQIDAAFAPITAAALVHAAPLAAEAVLDVGCGCGATLLGLSRDVGIGGRVVGVDVSQPMLAVAASRVREAELANVELVLADAATHAFGDATFDLAFSRFGVMFFDDPIAALANIRRSLRPNGRVAFACWRSLGENPWFRIPRDAVLPFVPAPVAPDPEAPGPLAFADPDRIRRILNSAGYRDVRIDPFDPHLPLGTRARAVDFLLQIGPASRLLDGVDAATHAAAARRLEEALSAHETSGTITLGAGTWLVRASA